MGEVKGAEKIKTAAQTEKSNKTELKTYYRDQTSCRSCGLWGGDQHALALIYSHVQ